MIRLLCVGIGYLFGLFQTGYILGRLQGIDIREYGSGNAGTTNMLRTKGLKAGVTTLLGDAFKCVFAVLLVTVLLKDRYPDIIALLKFYTAAGVILGHNFPFYLKFKGGKGIAATAGLMIALSPWYILTGCIVFFGIFFITHYVSLGSLCVYILLLIQTIIMGQSGFFGLEQTYLNEMYGVVVVLGIMAYVKHWPNIKRLASGTERKTYLSKKNRGNTDV